MSTEEGEDHNDSSPIDRSVPDTTRLAGRYFVNLPDVVKEESWWKTPPPVTPSSSVNDDDSSLSSQWIWRTIGEGFTGKARDVKGSQNKRVEIEVFPSTASKKLQLNSAYTVPKPDPPEISDYRVQIYIPNFFGNGFEGGIASQNSMIIYGEFIDEQNKNMTIIVNPIPVPISRVGRTAKFDLLQQPNIGRIVGFKWTNSGDNQFDAGDVTIINYAYPRKFNFYRRGFPFVFQVTTQESDGARSPTFTSLPFKTFPPPLRTIDPADEETNREFAVTVEQYINQVKRRKGIKEKYEQLYFRSEQTVREVEEKIVVVSKIQNDQETLSEIVALANIVKDTNKTMEEQNEALKKLNKDFEIGNDGEDLDSKLGDLTNRDAEVERYLLLTREEVEKIEAVVSFSKGVYVGPLEQKVKMLENMINDLEELISLRELLVIVKENNRENEPTTKEVLDALKRLNEILGIANDSELDEASLITDTSKKDALVERFLTLAESRITEILLNTPSEVKDATDIDAKIATFLSKYESDLEIAVRNLSATENELNADVIEQTVARLKSEQLKSKRDLEFAKSLARVDSDRSFDSALSNFLINDIQLPAPYLVAQLSDNIGFYSNEVTAKEFEVRFPSIRVALSGSSRLVLPTFGLMVRETLDPKSKYFGLFLVQRSVPATYSICTFVREEDGDAPELTGSWDIGNVKIDTNDTFDLRITRSGHMFKGFWSGRQIGEATLIMTEQSAKSKLDLNQRPNSRPSMNEFKTIRNTVNVGVACFPIPELMANNTKLPSPGSAKLDFGMTPRISIRSENSNPLSGRSRRAFSIIEYYNLSLFHGKYGAGRTLNTMSLLPGETTTISVKTYKDTSSKATSISTVFDEASDETAQDLENEIEREQSNESQYEDSMSYHVEASASYSGWGASASISAGFESSNSSARQNMSRSLMNSLNKHATKASSKRTVEVKTNETVESQDGSSSSVERTLRNINNSKTLTFIFRQMNQEYISVLHLVDIKVAYIGGGEGSYAEESISKLNEFVGNYIRNDEYPSNVASGRGSSTELVADSFMEGGSILEEEEVVVTEAVNTLSQPKESRTFVDEVADDIRRKARLVIDDQGKPYDVLKVTAFNTLGFDQVKESQYKDTEIYVPGFIIATDTIILRTDAVTTETLLGRGSALDKYGFDLQDNDILERKAQTNLTNAKTDLLAIQKTVVEKSLQEANDDKEAPIQQIEQQHRFGFSSLSVIFVHIFLFIPAMLCIIFPSPEEGKQNAAMVCILVFNGLFMSHIYQSRRSAHQTINDSSGSVLQVSRISELLRSLNLLEPKYLAHKGYGPEEGQK